MKLEKAIKILRTLIDEKEVLTEDEKSALAMALFIMESQKEINVKFHNIIDINKIWNMEDDKI